jgi:hypothetical protein
MEVLNVVEGSVFAFRSGHTKSLANTGMALISRHLLLILLKAAPILTL